MNQEMPCQEDPKRTGGVPEQPHIPARISSHMLAPPTIVWAVSCDLNFLAGRMYINRIHKARQVQLTDTRDAAIFVCVGVVLL